MTRIMPHLNEIAAAARTSKAWPFEEARKIIKRWPDGKPEHLGPVLFETGYGPSGLPHIGTFQEVLRTTMVRRAYEMLVPGAKTLLVAFSDDMDGLRKVPDNVPNRELLSQYIGHPLTRIPDPFGKYDSFAAHNNAMLCQFLDSYGFDYQFMSSTERYTSGAFDDALRSVLRNYDKIMGVMLPTLRAERAASYSPVLPISPTSGIVLQVPVRVVDADAGIIAFNDDSDGNRPVEMSILGGKAKLQWKPDWGMRWAAMGVDYEMCGKDLTDSVALGGKIARILGARPPEGMIYELFLDEKGEKISKSKGNGLSIEQWLTYGTKESLALFLYREPKSAKSLHIGVIARAVDEYEQFRAAYAGQEADKKLGNPAHHIHGGDVPASGPPVSFGLLLNLVGVLGARADAAQVAAYLAKHVGADAATSAELAALIDHALAYNRDYIAPTLQRRAPVGGEVAALRALDAALADLPDDATAEAIQNIVYAIGKDEAYGFASLRDWFRALYEILLGSEQGPRMGSFIALYGVANSRALIGEALA